jgi:flagellar biosynthetic protein FliR
MPVELTISFPVVAAFLAVLARVSGMVIFVPIPGFPGSPEAARIVLAVGLTVILLPLRPAVPVTDGVGWTLLTVGSEFGLGMLTGVCLAILLEGVQLAAQFVGLQAGYSFASTIDPSTQADSAVLQIVMQLLAGFLFFALGIDREAIRLLALPPAAAVPALSAADAVIRLGSHMFVFGLRLAMPVLAMLILMDLSFAILNKVHQQFQVMSLSFSAKMLVGLGLSAATLEIFPQLTQAAAGRTFETLLRLLGR